MALDPLSWALIGSSLVSAGTSLFGSNEAADAQKKYDKKALAEQQRQYNYALQMLEPQRALGYGAMTDLASLYGYALPQYTSAQQLMSGYAGGPLTVKGNVGGGGGSSGGGLMGAAVGGGLGASLGALGSAAGPLGAVAGGVLGSALGGSDPKPVVGGTIDPYTGLVDAQGGTASRDDVFSQYLRTGEWTGDPRDQNKKKYADLIAGIDRVRASGWQYQDPATAPPTAGPTGQAGNMERFFTSPDYTFRQQEGMDAIKNLASVRGGVGGNVLREGANFSSGLAAGEFGNYVNRLMAMAGLGQTATTQGVQAGQQTAANIGNLYSNMGDARASAYTNSAQGVNQALQGGLQNWLFYDALQRRA